MAGFTDEELGFGTPAQPQSPAQEGFSDDDLGFGPKTSITQAPIEYGKGIVRGFKNTIGGMLQGVAEAIPPDEGNAKRARSGQLIRQGLSYDEAIRQTEQEWANGTLKIQSPTETLTHRAGQELKRDDLTKAAPGWEGGVGMDIAQGFGSVAANIVPALLGGAGRGVATVMMPFGGAGEAAERARNAGQGDDTVRQAAQAGLLAGATDLADLALLRAGIGGAGASRVRRVLTRLVEGGLIEGTQEGLQQFIQNAIAMGIYKPNQDLSEDVLYNAFIGAIVGGGTKAVLGGGPAAPTPPPQQDIDAIVNSMNSGVAQAPPPGGTPPPAAAPSVPPPAGAQDFGLDPGNAAATTTVTPQQPVDAALGIINSLGTEPTPTVLPPEGNRTYPPGVELRYEDGMWNVYRDGEIDNAFGARSDADNYIKNGFTYGRAATPGDATPTYFPPKPSAPQEGQIDPEVTNFLAKKAPPLKAEELIAQGEEIQSRPGANLGRLAALLGPKLYGSPRDITSVSIKEIVQNSFDAIKTMLERGQIQKGRLDILLDRKSRTLTISDNGSGMAPEILGTKFLEIAGTHKESERASGGLGIAKMLFLFGNQNIEVVTLRDNKVSVLQSNGKQLFDALEDQTKAPRITVRAPTREDRVLFPEGHGTVVRVKIPETYVDTSTGETNGIPFETWSPREYQVLQNSPLFGDIEVSFNGNLVENMGVLFPKDAYTALNKVNFKWGTANVYVSKAPVKAQWRGNAHVLSNGLWQFSFKIPRDPGDPYGDAIDRNFYIDLNSKVKPEDPGYPFDLNRQQFSPTAKKDFEQLFHYISLMYQQTDLVSSMQNFGDIQYMDMTPSGVKAGDKQKVQPKIPPKSTAADALSEGDNISVVDGQLVVNGRKIPELTPEDLENFKIDTDALIIPQDQVDATKPILHDNVDVKLSDLEVVSITDLLRQKFGKRFDEFAYGMGKAFQDLRDVVAEITTGQKKEFVKGGMFGRDQEVMIDDKPWSDLRYEPVGVSFDHEYRGVSIRMPFSASFLNIAVPEFTDTLRAAVGMVGTMVHELAHHRVRSHNAAFPAEMQRIFIHLDTHPTFNFHEFKQRVVDIVQRHRDVFEYANGVMTNGAFPVQPRGKRFEDSGERQAIDGSAVGDVGASGLRAEGTAGVSGGAERGAIAPSAQSRSSKVSVRIQKSGPDRLSQQATDQRRLDSDASGGAHGPTATGRGWGSPGPETQFRQPEFEATRERLGALFQSTGGTPAAVTTAASHADRMNKWYKWMAGLDQLLKANPYFLPLRNYFSGVQQMHNDESRWQDAALRIAKRWRSLGDQGERLAAMFDDVANMRYRTADEIRRGIERHPTADELRSLVSKHKLDAEGLKVFEQVRRIFDAFLEAIKENAFASAQRIITDPVALAQKLDEIQAQIDGMRAKPYFPLMRFGLHYVMKKDAANRVVHFETFERHGFRSAESYQKAAFTKLNASKTAGEKVDMGMLPESSSSFTNLPSVLLETIKTQLGLTLDQITAIEHMQLMQSPALNFKRMMKSDYVPGYSMDFKRAFARYFFHGARYYARTKYGYALNNYIAEAKAVPNNKANMIGTYMDDHLQNTILDAKGDFGIFKGGIFIWALGYMPAAATMNLLQTPTVTFSHLAGKFGGIGLGNARATKAILKAAGNVKNYYRRGTYDTMTGFEYEALAYGIKTGRVSETQAPELAGISAGNNLLFGTGGNAVQRAWTGFMEKGAFMFEMAEQFNRRVAFRAALDLATKYPNAKAVREATQLYSAEYAALQVASSGRRAFTPAEAASIVTAVHTVDQTQFIYGRYARPRFMRGRVPGTLFVFKKYLQSMLFWMGQNKSDAMPQYLLMMALLGGLGGMPGYDDLRDLLRALARSIFGKDFNLDRKTRELVLSLFNEKVPPDLVLHGLARVGFGVPALLDLMGSWVTGTPGRGLQTEIAHQPSDPTGRATNVPFPVLDRHRALSMGPLLGFSPGNLMAAQGNKEMERAIAEETQKASGAVFGLGFNVYKMLGSEESWSDLKKYERAAPRALGALSRAYRAYSEGRERGRGGPSAAPTIVPYDVRDPEQMMEVIFMGLGYQTLRQQSRWDNILAKADAEKFYDGKRNGLLAQYDEALLGGNPQEIDRAFKGIQDFNTQLPDSASGQAISAETIKTSRENRARTRSLRELGLPTQKRNIGISQEIDRLYREGAVDVRPVR